MISVITCSVDDKRFNAVADNYARVLAPEPYEMVRIVDARSLAEGYNRGIDRSRGDLLIFSHDDIEILVPIGQKLRERLGAYDMIGVAGTTRLAAGQWFYSGPPDLYGQVAHVYPPGGYDVAIWAAPSPVVENIQALDGLFIAARREVAETIRFDAERFDGWHLYDLDFTHRAFLAGKRLAVCCDIPIIHSSYGSFDQAWARYAERFGEKFDERLPPPAAPRDWQLCHVIARSKEEVIEVMRPPHWGKP